MRHVETMSAIVQLQPAETRVPDPAILLAAVQAMSESVAIVESGRLVYANPAWRQIFDGPEESRLQRRVLDECVSSAGRQEIKAACEDSSTLPEGTFRHQRRDGTSIHLRCSSERFRLQGREFRVITLRDVSRERLAKSRLRQSKKLEVTGRMLSGVVHDFNNLLTGILLYCDLLLAQFPEGSPVHRYAQAMRAAGEQGSGLIQQLLAIVRPQANESPSSGLNEVISAARDFLSRIVGENISLITDLEPALGRVSMSPAEVHQIVLNLVLNARDAMPSGGRIAIATRNCTAPLGQGRTDGKDSPSGVELTVGDTGCGMDAPLLGRIFEPYFSTKPPGQGNGIGLASVRSLVRRRGGTISAESRPGQGTQVCVRLPREGCGASSHSESKAER